MAISRNTSFNFNLDFADYGDGEDRVEAEIKRDVLRTLETSLQSKFFSRSEGAGIESLENEKLSEVDFALYKFQIVNGLLSYNEKVSVDRQIIVSQDFVEIEEGPNPGEIVIKVLYFLARDSNRTVVVPQEISAVINAG